MRPPPRKAIRSVAERNELVLQYQKLPLHIVHKLWRLPTVRRLGFDDAVQIGFLKLLRAAELWEPQRGIKFISYAYRAISNGICEVARRTLSRRSPLNGAYRFPDQDWGAWALLIPTVSHYDQLVAQEAYAAWRKLPKRSRYVIWQVAVEGWKYSQVAVKLGITKERVRQLLNDAYAWLTEELDGKKPPRLKYLKSNKERKLKAL